MPITNAITRAIFLYLILNIQNPVLPVENAKKSYFGGSWVKKNTIFLVTQAIIGYDVWDLLNFCCRLALLFPCFIIDSFSYQKIQVTRYSGSVCIKNHFSENLQCLTIILKCEFVKFEGLLAFYISKTIPIIGKLIGMHLIIRFVCQRPCKLCICSFLRILGMSYIKVDPNNRETPFNTSCHKICMSGAPHVPF